MDPGDYWDQFYNFFSRNLPIFENGTYKRKDDWHVIGQSIFTPTNTAAATPSTKDRPYGAFLYTGISLLQDTVHETHHTLENVEVLGGVVGPLALGALTQDDFHELIGVQPSRGWTNQLHTEPGFVVTYERKWRFEAPITGNFAVDAIPEAGGTVGNIYDYAETGVMFRIGQNLGADYGTNHLRPNLSGTAWFDKDQIRGGPLGWYLLPERRAGPSDVISSSTAIRSHPARPWTNEFSWKISSSAVRSSGATMCVSISRRRNARRNFTASRAATTASAQSTSRSGFRAV